MAAVVVRALGCDLAAVQASRATGEATRAYVPSRPCTHCMVHCTTSHALPALEWELPGAHLCAGSARVLLRRAGRLRAGLKPSPSEPSEPFRGLCRSLQRLSGSETTFVKNARPSLKDADYN